MKLTINSETLLIADVGHRVFSAAEFAALEPPDCPVCGLPVEVQRLDVTPNREDEVLRGRSYIIGMWDCPRGCDPRTGERRHYDQEFGAAPDGMSFTCSCGTEEYGLTRMELAALLEEHKTP